MKYLLIILVLISGTASAQTKYYIRADSTQLEKVGGNNELILKNGTKSRTGGYLKNTFDGRTGFFYAVDSAYISGGNLVLVRGGGTQDVTVVLPGSTTPGLQDVITQDPVLTGNNTIDGGGNDLSFTNGIFTISSNSAQQGAILVQNGVTVEGRVSADSISQIIVLPREIVLYPHRGRLIIDTLNTGAATDSIMTWEASTGIVRKRNVASISAGTVPISGLTAATGTNSINNGNFKQSWDWDGLVAQGLTLNSNGSSTTSSADNTLLQLFSYGANANASVGSTGIDVTVGRTGTTATNVAGRFSASSGTNNYAIIVPSQSGSVGIGTSAPTSLLHVVGEQTTGIGAAFSSSTITTGTLIDLTATGTARAAGNEVLNIVSSGLNATNAITVTGGRISVTNTNATSGTNIGLDITASGATTNNLQLVLREPAASGTNYTAFKTQAQAADIVYTLPATVGGAATVLTDAAGDGILSWAAGGSGITINTTAITGGTSGTLLYDNGATVGKTVAITYNGSQLISTSTGGINTGFRAKATGSANYASVEYENDLGTVFQTGMYGSTAGSPGEAFFFHAAALPISFYTNSVKRMTVASTGEVMMSTSLFVGNVATTPTSTLQSGGSFAGAYVSKSANYTATVSDFTIECTANTFTVTLPTAVGIAGRIYNIANSGAGVITIGTTSSQTFVNVVATPTTLTLSAVGNYQVQSNGANWLVL